MKNLFLQAFNDIFWPPVCWLQLAKWARRDRQLLPTKEASVDDCNNPNGQIMDKTQQSVNCCPHADKSEKKNDCFLCHWFEAALCLIVNHWEAGVISAHQSVADGILTRSEWCSILKWEQADQDAFHLLQHSCHSVCGNFSPTSKWNGRME